MAIAASCQFMDHPPHQCAWAPGKPGPIQIHMLLYRLVFRMALDRAPHRLENTYCPECELSGGNPETSPECGLLIIG